MSLRWLMPTPSESSQAGVICGVPPPFWCLQGLRARPVLPDGSLCLPSRSARQRVSQFPWSLREPVRFALVSFTLFRSHFVDFRSPLPCFLLSALGLFRSPSPWCLRCELRSLR